MTTLQELLQDVVVPENGNEQGSSENTNPDADQNQVFNLAFWSKLVECKFEDEALKSYFSLQNEDHRKSYFKFAIECMMSFVQANFTGPDLPITFNELFNENVFVDLDFKSWLSVNREDVNTNVKFPGLLTAAICIFKYCDFNAVLNLWWQLRTLIIHQHILEELSPTLLSQADRLHKDLIEFQLEDEIKVLLEIELAQLYHIYRNIQKSEQHLTTAQEILGLNYELIGKLGKRTKFQEKEIAQLTLRISLSKDENNVPRTSVPIIELPKNLSINDEVRLDTITFKEKNKRDLPMSDLEQKLLLATIQGMIISKPQDNLYYEEVKPFLDLLLSENNTWAVRVVLLLVRSKLESKDRRTIARCYMQVEEILNMLQKPVPHPMNRVRGVYSTNYEPLWKTEAVMAELMLNTGMVKASLQVYLKLQLWEEVILCYTILNMRAKATEVIKQQLEVNPTVKLWCLLGDATDDINCYQTAWELSKKRSSRVQRHWGQYYFIRKEYQQCIPHFERSVSINPLQSKVWLNYGYAALEIENWQTAATAYRRYTTLEPGNFEAWNNLAKAYIKLDNKRGAHQALHDALRCNYENWKVWDNLMVVSAGLVHFSDVIRAYHRILDLNGKHLDIEVLGALVYGVCNNVNDSEGRPANRLLQKTRELLGRITSIYPTEGHVWELYASLAPVLLLRAQRLQRAQRGFMQIGWEKSPLKCQQVLYICHKLAEVALSEQIEPTDSLINNVRLSLTSSIVAVKKQDFKETQGLLDEVTGLLEKVIDKFKVGCTLSENK